MAQNDRPQNRAYSPYTDDSLDIALRNSDNIARSYLNPAYETSRTVQSSDEILRIPSTLKPDCYVLGSMNKAPELEHQYDDPSNLVICKRAWSSTTTGPKRKSNSLYESSETKRTIPEPTDGVCTCENNSSSWISRLILFMILMISLASLLLVVLVILGKLGPSCCNKTQGEGFNIVSPPIRQLAISRGIYSICSFVVILVAKRFQHRQARLRFIDVYERHRMPGAVWCDERNISGSNSSCHNNSSGSCSSNTRKLYFRQNCQRQVLIRGAKSTRW